MVQKIKYCSAEFLNYYKANFETEFLQLYFDCNKSKIAEIFTEDVVFESNIEFEYKPIEIGNENTNDTCFADNCKTVYTMFNKLERSHASKEELWFTLIHVYFLDELFDLIETFKNHKNASARIKNAIFFNHGNSRSQTINFLSRYWWIASRTYDEENVANPYWLTEHFTKQNPTGKSSGFFSSKFTANPNFALGIIEAIKEFSESGMVKEAPETYSYINEYFNFIGGVRILDTMERSEVKQEAISVLTELVEKRVEVDSKKRDKIVQPKYR